MNNQEQSFNGGYIEASQEAYDLLEAYGYEGRGYTYEMLTKGWEKPVLIVEENTINSYSHERHAKKLKQFYINKGSLSWDKPEEVKSFTGEDRYLKSLEVAVDYFIKEEQINSMEDELPIVGEEDISIIEFEAKIRELFIKHRVNSPQRNWFKIEISSLYKNKVMQLTILYSKETIDVKAETYNSLFSQALVMLDNILTPIKPKWYEDEANYPVLLTDGLSFIECGNRAEYEERKSYCDLATKKERDSLIGLYYEGKE